MKRFEINANVRIILQKENEAEALYEAQQLLFTLDEIQSGGEDNYDEQGIVSVDFGEPEVLKEA